MRQDFRIETRIEPILLDLLFGDFERLDAVFKERRCRDSGILFYFGLQAAGEELIVAEQQNALPLHGKALGQLDGHDGLAGTGTAPDQHVVEVLQNIQPQNLIYPED